MEASPRDPSVDKAIQAVSDKAGGPVPCPCCGHTGWNAPRDLISNVGVWMNVDPETDVDPEEPLPGWSVIPMLILACENCGFIRQHYIETPDEEVTEAT
jgi:hypothetical protein